MRLAVATPNGEDFKLKRTVSDRLDGAAAMDVEWEGDDAPTNAAPPDFARARLSRGNASGSFMKGVLVGAGVTATVGGIGGIGFAALAVALFGFPVLRTAPNDVVHAEVGADEVKATAAVTTAVPATAPVIAPVVRHVEPEPAAVVAPRKKTAAPKAAPVVASRKEPAAKPERAKPRPKPVVAKRLEKPAPVRASRPNRDELLELAIAAKQKRPAVAPVRAAPAPAASASVWDAPAEKQAVVAASEEKWVPVFDETEMETSAPAEEASADISDLFGD